MANEVSIYEPRHLIEVVRTTPPIRTFLRDRFFSNVKTFPTRRVDIDIVKGNRKMAAFIHPLVGGEIVQSEGYETKSYAPPLINPATISTADQYMERLPGEDLFSGRTPADRAAEKLIEEYNQLNDMTTRREEWMAAQVLTTGKLKVKGKGVDEVIDFGFGNKITLEGTKQWGKSAADPWGNLRDWKQLVSRNGFANADMVVMGKVAADNFMADGKILELMDKRRFDIGSMAPKELEGGLTYYHIALSNVKNASTIQENVEAAVKEYETWQRKIGRDIEPAELIMRVREAGAKRPRLLTPVETTVSEIQVAKLRSCKVTYGGIEDD